MSSKLKYYEEIPQSTHSDSCSGLREELKACLLATDCVKVHRKTPRECLTTKDPTVPEECHALRSAFFECKRSMLDMRQRFRGRKGY